MRKPRPSRVVQLGTGSAGAQGADSRALAALTAPKGTEGYSDAPVGRQELWMMLPPVLVARLSPNARSQSHWPRTRARERIMEHAATAARAQGLWPVTVPVAVTFRWVVNQRRKRDIDNLAGNGTVKAILDALVRAGYLVDDSTEYVTSVRTEVEYRMGERWLEIVLEPAP